MARKSTQSRPPSARKADEGKGKREKGKGEEEVCPHEETFSEALARLRSEIKAEVSPLLLDYLTDEKAQAGGAILYRLVHQPRKGLRLLPLSEDLPPLP